jgi:hypothetical protein
VWDNEPCNLHNPDDKKTKAVKHSKTSVNIPRTTGCNIPEDRAFHIHTRPCENLKSRKNSKFLLWSLIYNIILFYIHRILIKCFIFISVSGMRFALMQNKTCLVNILSKFELRKCAKTPTFLTSTPMAFIFIPKEKMWVEFVRTHK